MTDVTSILRNLMPAVSVLAAVFSAIFALWSVDAARQSEQATEYWAQRQYLPRLKVSCETIAFARATAQDRSNTVILTNDRAAIHAEFLDVNRGLVNEDGTAVKQPDDAFRCVIENAGEKPVGAGTVDLEAQSLPFHPAFSLNRPLGPSELLRSSDLGLLSLPFHPLLPGEKESTLVVNYGMRKLFLYFTGDVSLFSKLEGGRYGDAAFVNQPMHGDFVVRGVTTCSAPHRHGGEGMLLVRETCYLLWKHRPVISGERVRYVTAISKYAPKPLETALYRIGAWFNELGYKAGRTQRAK